MDGGVKVEVLDLRPDGTAKVRLWYYKWRRPIEFKLRRHKQGEEYVATGVIYVKKRKGILKEHLVEVAEALRKMGLICVSYYDVGGKVGALYFSECFLRSLFERFGAKPFRFAKHPQVEYLGGLSFKIGGYMAHFRVRGGRRVYIANVRTPYTGTAVWIATSLASVGIKASPGKKSVKLDTDSLIGFMIYSGAQPPGFTQLYASPSLYVFVEEVGARLYFYFAVKHKGLWRAVRGKYTVSKINLTIKERDLAKALSRALNEALQELGDNTTVSAKRRGGLWRTTLYVPQISRLLQHAADGVEAGLVNVVLEDNTLKIREGDTEALLEVETARGPIVRYIWLGLGRTLRLYKALRTAGVPVALMPEGVRIDDNAMWSLIAMATSGVEVGSVVAPGVMLANKYDVDGQTLYAYVYTSDDGLAVRFVLKDNEWKSVGGLLYKSTVYARGDVVAVAEALNKLYLKMGLERRAITSGEVLVLNMKDLEILGIKRIVVRTLIELTKLRIGLGISINVARKATT